MDHYTVGTSSEGPDAYPPLLLFKCLLLQKWFHIDSDPELESQINDRIAFKKSLELSFNDLSPDDSTFSRFRKRLSKEAMDQINSQIGYVGKPNRDFLALNKIADGIMRKDSTTAN